jgi:hypothetical protein
MTKAPYLRHIKPEQLTALKNLTHNIYSNKNMVDPKLTVGQLYSGTRVSTDAEKEEILDYALHKLGCKVPNGVPIDENTEIYFNRRFFKVPSKVTRVNERRERMEGYKDSIVNQVETYFAAGRGNKTINDILATANVTDLTDIPIVKKIIESTLEPDGSQLKAKSRFDWRQNHNNKKAHRKIEGKYDNYLVGLDNYVDRKYRPERRGQEGFRNKIEKHLNGIEKRYQEAQKDVSVYRAIKAILNFKKGGSSPEAPGTPETQRKSEATQIIEKLKDEYWDSKHSTWTFSRISSDWTGLTGDGIGPYEPMLDVTTAGSYTNPLNDGANHVDTDDHLLYTHSVFGYNLGGMSLIRKLMTDISAGVNVGEAKKVLGELATDARTSLSAIYGDAWDVLGKNLEGKPGILKDTALWRELEAAANDPTLPAAEQASYKKIHNQIVGMLRRIRKHEGTMMGLVGLLSGDAPITNEQREKLMNTLAHGDLSVDEYDLTDPANYVPLMKKLKRGEDDLEKIIKQSTQSKEDHMNTDFDQAKTARKRTEKIEEILADPTRTLNSYNLPPIAPFPAGTVTGVMDCDEADIAVTDVTLHDVWKYLRIREAYLHRDMRAAWSLILLKKAGMVG